MNSFEFQIDLVEAANEKLLILAGDYHILFEWLCTVGDDLDELSMINFELMRMMEKKKLLDRIEKGAELIERTTDAVKLAKYTELYEALHIDLLKVTEVERWNG